MSADFTIRDYKPEMDECFVFDSWLKSYKHMSNFAKNIASEVYFPFHRLLVRSILTRPSVNVFIAHPNGEPDVILGYAVVESLMQGKVVHYVLVKEGFRNFQIATKLLEHAGIRKTDAVTFTHWTFAVNALVFKYQGLKYNPYLI